MAQSGLARWVGVNPHETWSDWSRSTDNLDILQLQIHSSGKNPGWSRPFFGAHVETADPFGISTVTAWTLRMDVHLGVMLALCPFYWRKSAFWRGCPLTKYQQDIPVWFSSTTKAYMTQQKNLPRSSCPGVSEKQGTQTSELVTNRWRLHLCWALAKIPQLQGTHLGSRGKWFGSFVPPCCFCSAGWWHMELEDVNVIFPVAFPKKL